MKFTDTLDNSTPPEGQHPATIVSFIDLGVPEGDTRRQAEVQFDLGTGGRSVGKRFWNVSKNNAAMKSLAAATGINLDTGSPKDLLGKTCIVTIVHKAGEQVACPAPEVIFDLLQP